MPDDTTFDTTVTSLIHISSIEVLKHFAGENYTQRLDIVPNIFLV